MRCVICKDVMKDWKDTHNAEPARIGRCCTKCNQEVVIPLRLANLMKEKDKVHILYPPPCNNGVKKMS